MPDPNIQVWEKYAGEKGRYVIADFKVRFTDPHHTMVYRRHLLDAAAVHVEFLCAPFGLTPIAVIEPEARRPLHSCDKALYYRLAVVMAAEPCFEELSEARASLIREAYGE